MFYTETWRLRWRLVGDYEQFFIIYKEEIQSVVLEA